MSIYGELSSLKAQYLELKESLYQVADHPFPADSEPFLGREPYISSGLIGNLVDTLNLINDDLKSDLISEILEHIEEDSSLAQYMNFDTQSFQMELVNEKIDAYEEKLAKYQEDAASNAHDKQTELWDEAYEDVVNLMENLFPKLFGE